MKNSEFKTRNQKAKAIAPPSPYGGISPSTSDVTGDSIDEHRSFEKANIIVTGDEIRQQNENL
ncbi:hypothetical protein M3182_20575 [Mesobacillus maritimus]|uniref:hypothetical protein n=1 Tax=Mesobacillus maritimus TaxID=1643336 RepID=UPI0020413FA9|nr:hypothetical protein [Mesobacillus maritimus]MCM3588103.1 hypothetical protein [Mesobacillus maritimus]MCM3668433.1 hypothetical protein [Mesobacillus maritimus]